MTSRAKDSFPFEAVRDLLGILRGLFAAHKARGASARRLDEIRKVAFDLERATTLARDQLPGSAEAQLAFRIAERATLHLSDLVDVTTPMEPTLLAAGQRIRAHGPRASGREVARRVRNVRS
jgi:hypothetical protein